jgi:uncharacterized membrane protein
MPRGSIPLPQPAYHRDRAIVPFPVAQAVYRDAGAGTRCAAMAVVRAAVEIARPAAAVFAVAADRRARLRLLPDNFTHPHLLTEHTTGPGARFAFTIHTDRGAYDSVTEIVGYEPPAAFLERTTQGDTVYDVHWRFTPVPDGTRVELELRYRPSGGPVAWLLGRFARRALRYSLMVELVRLKQMIEAGTAPS